MNPIEDRLRAAAQAAADTVTPGSAPRLRLPASSGGRLSLRARLRRAAGRRVIAAVAAATAVAAVATVSVVVAGGTSRSAVPRSRGGSAAPCAAPKTASGGTALGGTPNTGPPPPATPAWLAGVPPYYVVLAGGGSGPWNAEVRATATGAVLATVTPPRQYGTFTLVDAAADDRTFVLAAQPWPNSQDGINHQQPTRFFLLCLNAAGQPAAPLKALPIPAEPASAFVDGIALSPNARRLAVVVQRPVNSQIVVFTLATGSVTTTWDWPTKGWVGDGALSWTANGRTLALETSWQHLAFAAPPPLRRVGLTTEVRLLNAVGPGGSLRSTRLLADWPVGSLPGGMGTNMIITPDGTKILAMTGRPGLPDAVVTEYSVHTGKIVGFVRVKDPAIYAGLPSPVTAVMNVAWSSTTGRTLIVWTLAGVAVMTDGYLSRFPYVEQYPDLPFQAVW